MTAASGGRGRVLQVYGPLDGGVPEHVRRLSEGLVQRGWEVEVAAPAASPAAQALAAQGLPLHPLTVRRPPHPQDLGAMRRLRALDRERRFDLVHAHSSKAGALARAALPRPNRLVYTPHCFAFAASFGALAGPQRQAYRIAEQALVPRTGTLVAVSEWERREGQRRLRGSAPRLRVVHNGVPGCAPAEPDPALVAFRGEERLAGSVCRLDAQKDPLTLVRAAGALARRGALSFRVALVGNGSLRDALEAEIDALGVRDRVRVFPFATDAAPYLAALDLFVLPSLWESFPISVLEAMACGAPVLATAVGGTPEAVQEGVTGRLVAPADPEALGSAMAAMLADPAALAAFGRAGRAAHAERFTVDRMVGEVAGLYEEALARG